MSKLIKLKEWVTIEQAAKHLSGIFEECVTDADVLQLALDGHLKISVNIPVYAYGRPGARKRLCDATIFVMPDWLLNLDRAIKSNSKSAANNIEEELSQIPTQIHTGIRVGEDEIIDFEDGVTKIGSS